MGQIRLSAALGAALVLAAAAAPAQADMVTLECGAPSPNPIGSPTHYLLDVDYSARTVRHYVVDDDTKLWLDKTWPADITDSTIDWSEAYSNGVSKKNTLGRYTGTLTETTRGATVSPPSVTVTLPCHPWTPPQRNKVF